VIAFFKRILSPPVFEDEVKNHQAYLLHIILWVLVLVPIPYVLYVLIKVPELSLRALVQGGIGELANIFLLLLLRRGHVVAAARIQVAAFWLFFAISAFTLAGVQSENYLLGFPMVILVAGILLGGRAALVVTACSLVAGGVLAIATTEGWIVPTPHSDPITIWAISLGMFPLSAALQNLASRMIKNALARAHASEEKYRLISRVSSDYAFSSAWDAQGNMRENWAAGAFESITGYTFEEYRAAGGWKAHLHPDDIEKDAQDLATLQANQKVVTEIRTYTRNKELRWVRVYAHPVWNDTENRLAGIIGAVQDITEQKRAEAIVNSQSAILEAVAYAAGLLLGGGDWEGILQDVLARLGQAAHVSRTYVFETQTDASGDWYATQRNEWAAEGVTPQIDNPVLQRAYPRLLGFTRWIQLLSNGQLIHGHVRDFPESERPSLEAQGILSILIVPIFAGATRWGYIGFDACDVEREWSPPEIDALRAAAGALGAAIQRKQADEERESLIDQLEAKNAELERFTYTVSHDLKSPLVTITGFIGFLEKDILTGNQEKVKGTIERINLAAQKMQSMLNELLELSRIGRIANPSVVVPFADIVKDAIERTQGRLDAQNARLEIQANLPDVYGDRLRLVEVMQNLIDNAAKFAGSQAEPRIEIGTDGMDQKGYPVFFVRDNGIGIHPQFHERIFGLFNKLDPQAEGTGIGLALVKRIIEVHGGRIWVESQEGQGATFYFTLPPSPEKE